MTPDRVLIHHSGGPDGEGNNTAEIRRYHTSYRIDYKIVSREEYERRLEAGAGSVFQTPWADVGYHCLAEKVGETYEVLMGRPWDMNGAHCPGQNDRALGICLVGDFNLAQPPVEQLKVAAKQVAFWCRHYVIPTPEIWRHDAWSSTDCPGDWFDIELFRGMVKELI